MAILRRQTSPSPQNQWIPYRSPTFLPFGSPTQFSGYPYSQPYQSPSGSSSHSPYHPNNAYTPHPYSSSSVQSLPLSTPSGTTIQNSNPNQPVVVPLNGGGFVVLPPGQHVQVIVSIITHLFKSSTCLIIIKYSLRRTISMLKKSARLTLQTFLRSLSLGT